MATLPAPVRAPDQTVDVVVLGAGPVGENVADRASRTGLSVVIVEAELVGGECSFWACVPSKALLRPGAARAAAQDVPGVDASAPLDVAAVLARRDRFVAGWDDAGQVEWLDSAGIALVRGLGRLVGERLVEIVPSDGAAGEDDGSGGAAPLLIEARHAVVLATGSEPVLPDVPGLAAAEPWSSREATSAGAVPSSLVVVGGGVVACEMATAYTDLGAQVTLLVRHGVLGGAEPFAGRAVEESLRAAGVDVRTGASPTVVSRPEAGGPVTVRFDTADGPGEVTAAELLVATGRVPRTGDVGLDAVGVTPNARGGLDLDETLQVRGVEGDWLYAAGDVTGRVATTHQGKYQGRVVGDVIAVRFGTAQRPGGSGDGSGGVSAGGSTGGDDAPRPPAAATDANRAATHDPEPWSRFAATADHLAQTQVVFTRPQVAYVGLTERRARDAGLDVRVVTYDVGSVTGGSLTGETYGGTTALVVDQVRSVVVGATFVGPDAGEMLHAATVAIVGEVPLDRLWHAVPAYPTASEVWLRLLEAYGL